MKKDMCPYLTEYLKTQGISTELPENKKKPCVLAMFMKIAGINAGRGSCGRCGDSEVKIGRFTKRSEESTTPMAIDDTHHL